MQMFKKDDIICGELPLFSMQTIDNTNVSLCCTNCASFLGTWTTQVAMILGDKKKVKKAAHRKRRVGEMSTTRDARRCASGNCYTIYCSDTCRLADLWASHAFECHCVDDVSEDMDDDAPTESLMREFHSHAEKTEEIFLAVGKAISTLIMHIARDKLLDALGNDAPIFRTADSAADVLRGLTWLEERSAADPAFRQSVQSTVLNTIEWFRNSFPSHPLPTLDFTKSYDKNSNAAAESELRDAACESWLLLHSALLEKGVSRSLFGQMLSKPFFATVLRALESYLHSVSATTNPMLAHFVDYLSNRNTKQAGYKQAPEEKYLEELLVSTDKVQREAMLSNKLLLISELNALANGTGSVAGATGRDGGIFAFDSRACHSAFMVLLPRCSRTAVHSCMPNAHITVSADVDKLNKLSAGQVVVDLPPLSDAYKQHCLQSALAGKTLRVDVVALRACNIGAGAEKLSISYVDDSVLSDANDLESRLTQLITRFPSLSNCVKNSAHCCSCSRCVFEGARINRHCAPEAFHEVLQGFATNELLCLGHTCMQQHTYNDAKLLYSALLQRLAGPTCSSRLTDIQMNDRDTTTVTEAVTVITDSELAQIAGDAFHALGAAYLEGSGDWERARRVWKFGVQMTPLHDQLAAEVSKVHCYPPVVVRVQPYISSPLNAGEVKNLLQTGADQFTFRRTSQDADLPIERSDALVQGVNYDVYQTVNGDAEPLRNAAGVPPFLGFPADASSFAASQPSASQVFLTSREQPLLTAAECRYVIDTTESFAARSGGWSTSRHYAVPTTDIPVHIIKSTASVAGDGMLEWFNDIFANRLAPLLASQYQSSFASGEQIRVAIHDAFVVKYEAILGDQAPLKPAADSDKLDSEHRQDKEQVVPVKLAGQRYLPLHCDQSSHSFTISLNSSGVYEGGGTYFPAMGTVIRPDCGQVLSFPGGTVLHGGEPISSGTRYIIAVFAYLAGPPLPAAAASSAPATGVLSAATDLRSGGCADTSKKRPLEPDQQASWPAKAPTVASSFVNSRATEEASGEKFHSFNFMLQ